MPDPIDQSERTRFVTELDRNFSVVASAGSGKTRAITDRIIAIATGVQTREWLPSLVVVTFTNRAADEMQQRARQRILEEGVPLDVLAGFNRAFFGTIHSFCVKLLRQHGHHLGLPGQLDLLADDDALWMEFVQRQTTVASGLTDAQRRCLLRLASVRELMELGRGGGARGVSDEPGVFPAPDFEEVFAAVGRGNAKNTVAAAQERLRVWECEWRAGDGFLPMPECGTAAKDFVPLWEAALEPVREWLRRCSLIVAAEVGRCYRAFRLAKGAINYDDQIALAGELLRHPEAARRIRERNYRVILDEAQDTDPAQFDALIEITRPPGAAGAWLESAGEPPRPGHFCMVGDFQQSIFGERADLGHYRRVHDELIRSASGSEVRFSVTFRLDAAQIGFVNAMFRPVLNARDGQVGFVELNPRPGILPGQVVRFDLGELPVTDGWKDWQRARLEAQRLADWLRELGPERLRAQSWRDVAILCPRKNWFPPLRDALRAVGIDVQIQSERDIKGDSPARAWFTALAAIMASPRDAYEIVGVLREVFGISDHDLAAFSEAHGERFQIAEPVAGSGVVAETLSLLGGTRAFTGMLPLFSAMQEICHATRFCDRLLALPAEEFEGLDGELDDLLTLAATAEAAGETLAGFAAKLRADFSATREVRTTTRDAIQLITCHKAKGSEWQAVIVPFFARGVAQRSRKYPRLLRNPEDGSLHAALDSADIDGALKALLDTESRQELERLLYVGLTRAEHTLVLADDLALFSKKTLPKNAAARLLNCGAGSPFAGLPVDATRCDATVALELARIERHAGEQAVAPLAPSAPGSARIARDRAALFSKRNPSALAEAALADADPSAYEAMTRRVGMGAGAGARYGTWWHGFIEHIDWRADPGDWDAAFSNALADSPDAELSKSEWALLRAHLASGSDLARWLTAPGAIAHAELPFLWAMGEGECLEGIIDLAIFDPAAQSWLLVDWKTNRTCADELPRLHVHYLPQLSAYWKAVSQMSGIPVVAVGLYSTATGAWLPYEADALASAWDSMKGRPQAISEALAEP